MVMSPVIFKATKLLVILTTIQVLLFGFFCVDMFYKTSVDAHTTNALTISEQVLSECCNTLLPGHLDTWKNTFLSITQDLGGSLLMLAISFIVAVAFSRKPPAIKLLDAGYMRYRSYLKQHPNSKTFSSLRLAFSKGILNPKLY